MAEPGIPPGWYQDPNDPYNQRYWDGNRWTENRAPAAGHAGPGSPTNGKAIAGMVLGIVWLCGIGSILALVFGYQAKREIEASGGLQEGRGMAIAGIVLGWVGVGFLILYVVVYGLLFGGALLLQE
jgi:hypothetical protein